MIHRQAYTQQQLIDMEDFIEKQKLLNHMSDDAENNIPNVDYTELNKMQLFVECIFIYTILFSLFGDC